jgi:guanylate kinase
VEQDLIILSAPSGTGKQTVKELIVKNDPTVHSAVSWTTREQRPGEIDGVHYHFVIPEMFQAAREADEFVEAKEVYTDCWYGTHKSELYGHKRVLLEIDVAGAAEVKQRFAYAPEVRLQSIFLLVKSPKVLEERLRGRNPEMGEAELERRLAKAPWEVAQAVNFDSWVLNDDVESAVGDILLIISLMKRGLQPSEAHRNMGLLKAVQEAFQAPLLASQDFPGGRQVTLGVN